MAEAPGAAATVEQARQSQGAVWSSLEIGSYSGLFSDGGRCAESVHLQPRGKL